MAGTKKINKAKARIAVFATYEVLSGMDGNPNTPKEFDESHHDDDEVYFRADDDANQVEKNKVAILNFIHQALHHGTERKVPVLKETDNPDIEVYHRVKYRGIELDVCVYWPPREDSEFKSCMALVKFASDDLSDEHGVNGVISTDASWNADAKADKFTKKNDKLKKNYWAPRWKYIVNALRKTAYERYEKNGTFIPEPEPEVVEGSNNDGDNDSQVEREELMEVFYGCTGKIIGPKGAKIQEIKKTSGVTDIKMPAKSEDGPRPKAREPVNITIIGKGRAIATAKTLIQAVVDEWANAPRPPRDGGGLEQPQGGDSYGSGDGGFGGGGNYGTGENNSGGDGGGAWDTNGAGGGDNGGVALASWDSGAQTGGRW